jgi:UDP-GlcNAc:undecaprenyl-phosphate/decaprenyl-phosphate GlcNAc-1-phosphate transferase
MGNDIFNDLFSLLRESLPLFSLLLLFGALFTVIYIIPHTVYVAHQKRLSTPIVERSSHSTRTPAFGGVSIFLSLVVSVSVIEIFNYERSGYNIIAAITLIFIVGLRDDLVDSKPKGKLLGQIIACSLIVFSNSFQVENLHGFLGIYELNSVLSYFLSMFFMLAVINAFNLIDGIDGLAGSIGVIIIGTFGIHFLMIQDYFFFLLSVGSIGALLGFLRYNLSKGRLKIFLGDCGSLVIGLLIGILSLRYLSENQIYAGNAHSLLENKFMAMFYILFIPIFDTTRVILVRLLQGKSPFEADKNHLHHVLLRRGFSHRRASFILACVNFLIIMLYISLSPFLEMYQLLFFTMFLYLSLAFIIHKLNKINIVSSENIDTKEIIKKKTLKSV